LISLSDQPFSFSTAFSLFMILSSKKPENSKIFFLRDVCFWNEKECVLEKKRFNSLSSILFDKWRAVCVCMRLKENELKQTLPRLLKRRRWSFPSKGSVLLSLLNLSTTKKRFANGLLCVCIYMCVYVYVYVYVYVCGYVYMCGGYMNKLINKPKTTQIRTVRNIF
jgi:hypothetical protein